MQSRRTVLWALTALLASSLPMAIGCKEEVPIGRIKPDKIELKVDELAHIELLLSTNFEGVSREMWKVEPAELGEVYFNQAELKRRKATFRGKTPGKGKISVYWFYGVATKPYRLADVPVTVE